MRDRGVATGPWWTLVAACSGLFLLMLDSTVVTLALPAIQGELDATASELQWMLNAYLLVIAALVVTAGRVGDIVGRRTVFAAGLAVFIAGSALAGAAGDPWVLIAARVVQGLGAAPMLALSLAIVSDAFPAGLQARALGIWAAVSALALAIGPVVGGALVSADWRLIFWMNIPIGVVGLAVTAAAVRESRDSSASHGIDVPGLLTLAAGLTAVVLALVESDRWGPAPTLALLGLGAVALPAFWRIEHRVGQPIVEFELFRNRPYLGASASAFFLVGAYWSLMFFQPQYLQTVLGHSAIASGLLILPMTAPMVVISPLAGRLIARFGARVLMTAGMVSGTAGCIVLARIGEHSDYGLLLAGYLLFGIALGLVYAPMSTAAMAAMPRDKAGIASGVLAMNRVMAGAVGLALTGAIFQALRHDDSFATALGDATWALVAMVAIGAALTWLLVAPRPRERDVAPAGDGHELRHRLHNRRFHL